MNGYEASLAAAAALCLILSIGNRRALYWLAVGVADYLVTSAYSDFGLPSPPFFTAMVDGCVVGAVIVMWNGCNVVIRNRVILAFRKRDIATWEAFVGHIFLCMMATDLFRLFLTISDYQYRVGLETLNYVALLILGGPRIIEWADAGVAAAWHRADVLHRVNLALSSPWSRETFLGHKRA